MHSPFKDLESYLRILSSLDEKDFHLFLKQYNSNFTTCKVTSGAYTFEDISEVFSRGFEKKFELRNFQPNHIHDKSDSTIIESDNVTLIFKLNSRYDIKVLRFYKKSFFITILGFSPDWDYKNPICRDNES